MSVKLWGRAVTSTSVTRWIKVNCESVRARRLTARSQDGGVSESAWGLDDHYYTESETR